MADVKNNMSTGTTASGVKKDLSYDDKVIQKIVGIATKDVPGILTVSGGPLSAVNSKLHVTNQDTSGVDAEVGKKQVALDLNVVCEYGKYVPETFDAVISKVTKAVKDMTGLEVIEINMHVQDVLSPEDFAKMEQQQNQSVAENFGMNKGQQQNQQPQYDASGVYNGRVQ